MTCHTFKKDGFTGVVCTRGSRRVMLCDGCDQHLDPVVSVSPKEGLDFCPSCFDRAWKHWLSSRTAEVPVDRQQRRQAFREWARSFPDVFLEFCSLTDAARSALEAS